MPFGEGEATLRDHYEAVARTGRYVPQLELPPLPSELVYIMGWFHELASRRQVTMAGAQPILFSEIDAWARCMNIRPTPQEISVMCQLDNIYMEISAERLSRDSKKNSSSKDYD